ncbi:hypothetical protein [Myxacorys almedinensis]|uniref:Uncharacterized protein n=1 Tax=Myxacorys almedinensis A TaxID=2690445 RepID=A0A8J7Z796_9CYAN|nr:hypothetical protein [Myxacorys almedinensis]NDJ19211.1 hypothetical protein [Myxacorys almedinensis A]
MASNVSNLQFSNSAVLDPHLTTAATLATSLEKMKTLYQADQQAKLLNLQAETETLLHRLQELKQQRTEEMAHP